MGREIRRVPPDWEHPRRRDVFPQTMGDDYVPTFDKSYREAAEEWIEGFSQWLAAGRPKFGSDQGIYYFWDWDGGPPDSAYYREREWSAEEATAYQVYETVTEGTPISPVLLTRDAVVEWVSENMDVSRAAAEKFAETGWAPSFMISGRGVLASNVEVYEPGFPA